MGSCANWITRSRSATPPAGASLEIQLCGTRGPVSTRWPGWKWPM